MITCLCVRSILCNHFDNGLEFYHFYQSVYFSIYHFMSVLVRWNEQSQCLQHIPANRKADCKSDWVYKGVQYLTPNTEVTVVVFIVFCKKVTALTQLWLSKPYRTNSQILQCICPISHNAPFCNRNVHTSATKWCIVIYLCNALWGLWGGSIMTYTSSS